MVARTLRRAPAVLITALALTTVVLTIRPIVVVPEWPVVFGRLAAVALVGAGITDWLAGRPSRGVAAALAGVSWAGVTWAVEAVSGSEVLVGAGFLIGPLTFLWLVVLARDLPTPVRVDQGWDRLMMFGALVAAIAGIARALVYQPILDLRCGPFCGHSPVVVSSDLRLAGILGSTAVLATVAVASIAAIRMAFGLAARQAGGRRRWLPAALVASGLAAFAAGALVGLIQEAAAAEPSGRVVGFAVQSGACLAIAAAALAVAWRRTIVRRDLATVMHALDAGNGSEPVETVLQRAVGDPRLRVLYWTETTGFVGADGRPEEDTSDGRQRTALTSRGRRIAMLIHDPETLPRDVVDATLGPQARLAIQNESLQLELVRRLHELRASRRRVVEAGDAERERLEHDLHDGAQQLLLALSFELRRGERAAVDAVDARSAALFRGARDASGRILEQLRVLAHGIHPSILTGAGLEAALVAYARSVQPPPVLEVSLGRPLGATTEAAIYAVATALVSSTPAGRRASIAVSQTADAVRVVVDGATEVPEYVLDRVAAVGGSSAVEGRRLEFVLPCA